MNQLSGLMDNIMAVQIIDIVIAVSIVILFRIFSSSLSYICIKMFKFKTRNKKENKRKCFLQSIKSIHKFIRCIYSYCFFKATIEDFR